MDYKTKWNGITRGDNVTVNGQLVKFIHAAFLDGEVQYVMTVTKDRQWRQVKPSEVTKQKRSVK